MGRAMTSSTQGSWNLIRVIGRYLKRAGAEGRVLVTIDGDFGELVYVGRVNHAGLVRLPDVAVRDRIALMAEVLREHRVALESQALITVRAGRVRVTHPRLS